MKRILTLDGGGIRGVLSLQILRKIEHIFRQEKSNDKLVLSDEFDFFSGNSTGSLIATGLAWGLTVDEIEALYFDFGHQLFRREPWHRRWKSKYNADSIGSFFKNFFSEDNTAQDEALLGTSRLKTLLMIVLRNASTGSPWPLTNNPKAKYNRRELPDCNLDIPLWQLLRASTAAPTFFPPQPIQIGDRVDLFVDGAITPYNNPSLITALTAILPAYNLCWPTGPDQLQVISVGTGSMRTMFPKKEAQKIHMLDQLGHVAPAIMSSTNENQDLACRVLGKCVYGSEINSEIGDLLDLETEGVNTKLFGYIRYNLELDKLESNRITAVDNKLDRLELMPLFKTIGEEYASDTVKREHIFYK